MKKYIAPCTISLDLTFEDGRHRHVNFDTCTGLGSYFVTNDPEEIWALEHHYLYDKERKQKAKNPRLFKLTR